MKKQPKRYPMNGPSAEVQRMMERPRLNHDRLKSYFGDRAGMRRETLAILDLK